MLLQILGLLSLPHYTVPLVNQEDKLTIRFYKNIPQRGGKPPALPLQNICIFLPQFPENLLLQIFRYIPRISLDQKLLHVQTDHIILVQIFLKGHILRYLITCK